MIKNVFKKTKKGYIHIHVHDYEHACPFVFFCFAKLKIVVIKFNNNSLPPLSRLLVHFSAEMISRFEDEDDFVIELPFDNQKGCFDLCVRY